MNFVYIAIVYMICDALWIRAMTPILYQNVFETIQKSPLHFNTKYAFFAYIILLGVIYFVCRPLATSKKYENRPWLAYALVGFAMYSVYNLTNAAVFTNYPAHMVLIDTLWGTIVFSILGKLDSY